MPHKLTWLEAGRGIAALLVVLFHATVTANETTGAWPLRGLFAFGFSGVDFFFVLSGFIIMFVHRADIGQPHRLRRFAWRRFARIFPLYWAVLALHLAVFSLDPKLSHTTLWPGLMVKSALLVPQHEAPIVLVSWTLPYELLFYALFGALIVWFRVGVALLTGWFLAVLTANLLPVTLAFPFDFLLNIRNLGFFIGMAAALGAMRASQGHPVVASAGFVALIAAGVALVDVSGRVSYYPDYIYLMLALASGAIVFGMASYERIARRPAPALLVTLGAASYSIYLIHLLVMLTVRRGLALAGVSLPADTLFCVFVAAAVAGGLALHWTIERPVLAMLAGVWARVAVPKSA